MTKEEAGVVATQLPIFYNYWKVTIFQPKSRMWRRKGKRSSLVWNEAKAHLGKHHGVQEGAVLRKESHPFPQAPVSREEWVAHFSLLTRDPRTYIRLLSIH